MKRHPFILVRDVKIVHIPENPTKLYEWRPQQLQKAGIDLSDREAIVEETISGRKFTNMFGETVILGMAKDVQELLGMPFQGFEEMERRIEHRRREIDHLRSRVQQASFWKRLKYLFTGRIF